MENEPATKTRVLFLDDDDNRHHGFDQLLIKAEVTHVYTATQTIDKLLNSPPFDLVCLDHDLDLVSLIKDPGDGMDVARFIAYELPKEQYPKYVLVHSWNITRAFDMVKMIEQTGIPVAAKPYSPLRAQ